MATTSTNTTGGNTNRQFTWWNVLRPIKDVVLPCWGCGRTIFFSECLQETSTVTGTIICPVSGHNVTLCMQMDSKSLPLIVLELPLNTSEFAGLIRCGLIRIILESVHDSDEQLLSMQRWVMHCNGQKMGFAVRREVTENDTWFLEMMQTVSAGAGILTDKESGSGGYKYLRGQFERVVGCEDLEAFYLIDPSGCFGQELSVVFLRH